LTLKQEMTAIVGAEHVIDDRDRLTRYAGDHSLAAPCYPRLAVRPANTEEVQAVVKYASDNLIPITPRSSAVGFHGTGIPSQGGILLDLGRMNRILEIDPLDRKIKVEPGVTWAQVQTALKEQGMMVCSTLLPHRDKSVLTATMEREPMLINKSEYNENFLTGEIVIGNGELFWMGTALAKGMVGQSNPEAFILGTRLFRGHQGTLGVVTWANLKAEFIPARDKLYFIPCETIEDIAAPLYRTQHAMIGGELFALNNVNFASILAQQGLGQFETLRGSLPPYTIAINLHGLRRDPDGRIAYEEVALEKIAGELGLQPTLELAGVKSEQVMELLRSPWAGEPYWRFHPKPGSAEIFFHSTLDRAADFTKIVSEIAEANGYPPVDIGVYVQPIERARIAHFSFSLNYDPADAAETEIVSDTFLEVSRAVTDLGGLFTTPYGPWAEMVFSRATGYVKVMRAVKDTFDPNHIMNPGKLCF